MKTHNINTDTPLVPYLIAEKVVADRQPGYAFNNELEDILVSRAEKHYSDSEHFRKQINNSRTDCREVLKMFMAHWLQSAIIQLSIQQLKSAIPTTKN